MNVDLKLNELWSLYVRGDISRDRLLGALYSCVTLRPECFRLHRFSPEECADFLSWLYPRICAGIDKYQDVGVGFEGYFYSLVSLSRFEYHEKVSEHSHIERAVWYHRSLEVASEQEEPYQVEQQAPRLDRRLERRVLILALKCSLDISDPFAARIADGLRMPRDEFRGMVHRMRQLMASHEERYRSMQRRVESQFFRMLGIEARYRRSAEGSARRQELELMRERSRHRLESMRRRLPTIRRRVPNRVIAEVLGIPKGTVDSSMFYLRKYGEKMATEKAES